MKRVAFYTLGCKVNQYDTEAMMEQFRLAGYELVDFSDIADVYIINTCTVTNLGDRKSRQMVRRAHRLNAGAIIGVVGCYAQRAAEEVLAIPGVRFVMGTKNRNRIVEIVEKAEEEGIVINAVEDILTSRDFEELTIDAPEGHTRAFLKIQEGCEQFCSYCIIPYVRGPIRSRKRQDILKEVKRLEAAGFKEIVLTGIHLASYGRDSGEGSLAEIIADIHSIDGIERIRLGSVEPTLLTPSFVERMASLKKVCPHYHVSLQSGSDHILRRMNRKYTTEEYRQFIRNLRSYIPDAAVTTDVMVGFPGEEEEHFQETFDFVQEIAFSKIHVFQYSPRKGTLAAKMKNQVSTVDKETRSKRLIKLADELGKAYVASFLGTAQKVLFEEEVPWEKGWLQGFTDHYIKVMAEGDQNLKGSIAYVLLKEQDEELVRGSIVP
ncbi:MAG: tRNA (N(6)-L-threonylcarbamoyladenosine(37)-C(2))-methylthiotransferase MtaB [Clostridia bacterium]